jgi:hypothetical protein
VLPIGKTRGHYCFGIFVLCELRSERVREREGERGREGGKRGKGGREYDAEGLIVKESV